MADGSGSVDVDIDVDRQIGRITFVNPASRNALTASMAVGCVEALKRLDADGDTRVIIITGSGEEAFMSGAHIREQGDPATSERFFLAARAMFDALDACATPLIAMIRGFCIGGGVTTALKADYRVAGARSSFAIPAARLGVGYPLADVATLVEQVGVGHAADLLFTGRRLDAAEAHAIGLVERVCPDEQVDRSVSEFAETIAANAPLTVRAAKAAIQSIRGRREPDEVERLIAECWSSDDYAEGVRAFGEKRRPDFGGRRA